MKLYTITYKETLTVKVKASSADAAEKMLAAGEVDLSNAELWETEVVEVEEPV